MVSILYIRYRTDAEESPKLEDLYFITQPILKSEMSKEGYP